MIIDVYLFFCWNILSYPSGHIGSFFCDKQPENLGNWTSANSKIEGPTVCDQNHGRPISCHTFQKEHWKDQNIDIMVNWTIIMWNTSRVSVSCQDISRFLGFCSDSLAQSCFFHSANFRDKSLLWIFWSITRVNKIICSFGLIWLILEPVLEIVFNVCCVFFKCCSFQLFNSHWIVQKWESCVSQRKLKWIVAFAWNEILKCPPQSDSKCVDWWPFFRFEADNLRLPKLDEYFCFLSLTVRSRRPFLNLWFLLQPGWSRT